jgi:hypothetical protein
MTSFRAQTLLSRRMKKKAIPATTQCGVWREECGATTCFVVVGMDDEKNKWAWGDADAVEEFAVAMWCKEEHEWVHQEEQACSPSVG